MTKQERKELKELMLHALHGCGESKDWSNAALLKLLERAYELGEQAGYAKGVVEGVDMGVEGW